MNMRASVILIVFLLNFSSTFANEVQSKASLRGNVYDKEQGAPLPGVQLRLQGTHLGDAADSTGYYEISNIPIGKYVLHISRIGYKSDTVAVAIKSNEVNFLDIYLFQKVILLQEVVVEAGSGALDGAAGVGVESLSARDLQQRPAALNDVMRTLQTQVGITGAGDYTGHYSVRGGGEYENVVIVDGVIIHNPYRFRSSMGAGLSDVNPNTVKNLTMHLAGYSAKYGNALASVLEIQSEYGEERGFGAEVSISPLEVNAMLHSSLLADKGSTLISFRKTYYDILAERLAKEAASFPSFSELSGKMTLHLNEMNKLDISLSKSSGGTELLDNVSSDLNITEDSATKLLSLRWRATPNENRQNETILSYYNDETSFDVLARELNTKGEAREQQMMTQIKNLAFSHDMLFKIKKQSWLNVGLQTHFIASRARFISSADNLIYARRNFLSNIDYSGSYQYYAGYLEYSAPLSKNLHVRSGLRYDHHTLGRASGLAPRLAALFKQSDNLTFKASWGVIYQYPEPASFQNRHPMVDVSRNTQSLTAEKAIHYLLEIEKSMSSGLEFNLDIYYRELDRLILPADNTTFLPTNKGIGVSRGIEFKFERKASADGRFNGFLSYALAHSQYRSIESKNWIPAKFDRRHTLKFFAGARLFNQWSLSLLGQMANGLPYTNIVGFQIRGDQRWTYTYGATNGAQFPFFHKLDIRLSYGAIKNKSGLTFNLDLLNVTNQKNIYDIIWEVKKTAPSETLTSTKRTLYMLPFLPSFGLTFRF